MIAPQDREGGDLSWLFQLVAVFVFFVLPVLRSIAEARKKGREGAAGRATRPARKPAQVSGREQWRDLLEGREPQAPARRAAPPAQAPAPRPAPRAPDLPAAPRTAPPLEVAPRPLAPAVPVLSSLSQGAPLEVSFTPSPSELGAREIDPATLDDELAARWSEGLAGAALATRSTAAAALLGGRDWRSAIVLAEVLAPPLALRGPGAAWPGPPASLGT